MFSVIIAKRLNVFAALLFLVLISGCSDIPPSELEKDFPRMLAILEDVSVDTNTSSIAIYNKENSTADSVKYHATFHEITSLIAANNVETAYFFRDKENISAVFLINKSNYGRLAGQWSYQYSQNNYTEEDQVNSIVVALEQNQSDISHFCQPLSQKHWFLCFNRS
jgi:hypothetical protein